LLDSILTCLGDLVALLGARSLSLDALFRKFVKEVQKEVSCSELVPVFSEKLAELVCVRELGRFKLQFEIVASLRLGLRDR
jgi:hypothetical protein